MPWQAHAPVAVRVAGLASGTDALGCAAPAAPAGVLLGAAAIGRYQLGPKPACARASSLKGGCTQSKKSSRTPWHACCFIHWGTSLDEPEVREVLQVCRACHVQVKLASCNVGDREGGSTFRLPLKYVFTREWNHCSTLRYCLASSIQGTAALEAVASPEASQLLSCCAAGCRASAADDSCASVCR